MELIYTLVFVVIVTLILLGLTQTRSTPKQFFHRNYPLENFENQTTQVQQAAGASIGYNWGTPIPGLPEKKACTLPPKEVSGVCPTPSCPVEAKPLQSCDQCDILKHPDIKYFVLKSSIKAQPDMSEYVRKSEITPPVNMNDYIKKSEIPACPQCPNLSDYVKKSSLPAMPECPKCPTCPVCPVCDQTYANIEEDPRFAQAFRTSDITKHPGLHKYILKEDAQKAMNQALKDQAETLLTSMKCPKEEDKDDKKEREVKVKDAQKDKPIRDPRLLPSKQKIVQIQAEQQKPLFSALFPENARENEVYRTQLPRKYRLPEDELTEVQVTDAKANNGFFGFFSNWLSQDDKTQKTENDKAGTGASVANGKAGAGASIANGKAGAGASVADGRAGASVADGRAGAGVADGRAGAGVADSKMDEGDVKKGLRGSLFTRKADSMRVTSSEIPPDYTSPAVWRGSTFYQGTC